MRSTFSAQVLPCMISKALLGSINNIRKLQSGTSLSSLAPNSSSRRAQATVVKTWDISTSSTIHYIRNMIHGRTSFSQTLHQFSKMMIEDLMAESKKNVQTCKDKGVKTSNKSSKRKANISDGNEASTQYTREPISLLETDIVKFMTKLCVYFEEALERLSFDYMAVYCVIQSSS